jgi:uncharacterized protein DUF3187
MRCFATALACAVVPAGLGVGATGPSGADPALGESAAIRARLDDPVALRSQFPLTLPFLSVTPRSAFLPGAGTLQWKVNVAYESTHALSADLLERYSDAGTEAGIVTRAVLEETAAASSSGHAYYVDGETARLLAEVSWTVTPWVELTVGLPLLAHTGGVLDGPIESYHEAFGFSDGGRPPFARDQYVVGLSDAGHTVFLDGAPGGLRPGDLLTEARFAIAASTDGGFALAGSATLEWPTGDPDRLDGGGSLDTGAGLVASWRMRRTTLHAGAQVAWLGGWESEPALASRHSLSGFFSGAVLVGARTSIVGGLLGSAGPFPRRSGGDLGDTAFELSFGVRHATNGSADFEVGLLENILTDHNVPDVGFFVGWIWGSKQGNPNPH